VMISHGDARIRSITLSVLIFSILCSGILSD
jgi:hypothetical protein